MIARYGCINYNSAILQGQGREGILDQRQLRTAYALEFLLSIDKLGFVMTSYDTKRAILRTHTILNLKFQKQLAIKKQDSKV